jgi:transglutaminase-like putative cysteine protease
MEVSTGSISRMSLFEHINLISVFLFGLFLLPMVFGIFRPLTGARIFHSFSTTVSAAIMIISAIAAVSMTNYLYSNNGDNFLSNLFKNIDVIRYSILTQDVLVYILFLLTFLIAVSGALQLLFIPLNKKAVVPLSNKMATAVASKNKVARRLISALWQFPKSVWLVLVFTLLFNFYTAVSKNTTLGDYISNSDAYRLVEENAIRPIVTSDAVRQIPDFIDGTVDKVVQCLSPEGRKLLIKVYINGVTIDDAVRSSPDIDNIAIDLVGAENDRYTMGEILYVWIADSISYDHEKADQIETDAFMTFSGAVPAFSEKTGVCFDKACLYVAMCRAVGVRVRLITGRAFNGSEWLDHSWNEIYDDSDGRWVTVDTTFGGPNSDYFDRRDFADDHADAEIQGEW